MKRATIRTTHVDSDTAERLARAVRPDNTDEMHTTIEDDALVTTIERETTGGLQSTVDDYVVNLSVAAQLSDHTTTNNT
ncbi:hypothetical protein SAMN05216559_1542 [Halomicrobium zhouii]|uniref:KEOPS complex subunit Pcc1 n=1 Tax=Halomicrobium zhouii TaxID=767519 RepID=A0A1I6KU08_9EURY|nr:KEOPS complex subunit Pcc1 [Halomicrobium zhouii]SFR94508.1 hypothetical protein SAMN05216559_1542 [Halomicrobium zhouii]